MPKAKLSSVLAIKTKVSEGAFCIYGRDPAGRELEIELPLSAIRRLAAETHRAALQTPRASSLPANPAGQFNEVVPLDITSAAVGTLMPPAGPAVGVVFDPGRDTELAFRLPPRQAIELGQLLLTEGEKLKDSPPPQVVRKS